MRAWNKPPEGELRERYLGEIAPLLEAARELEPLSPMDKKRVRKRIVRTLFGTRRPGLRARLVPVLVALALLVVGGAAFATAQRLGIIPRLGAEEPQAPAGKLTPEPRKRRAARTLPATQPTADVVVPPGASLVPAAELAPVVPPPAPLPARQSARRSLGKLAMQSPPHAVQSGPAAPVIPAPPMEAFPVEPMRAAPVFVPSAPVVLFPPPASPALPAPPGLSTPSATAPPVHPIAPASPTPQPQPQVAPAAKPVLGDQRLFGQALRKLRAENDPSGALSVLREHRTAYPKSVLSGERTALEVESLLALHRDKDALSLLDTVALEGLPRSGERFVVRGELRAAAKRWREANADFEHALSRISGSPLWHERALWGRGVSRLRLGDKEGGLADIERYRDTYPKGRFAAEAAKFFPGK